LEQRLEEKRSEWAKLLSKKQEEMNALLEELSKSDQLLQQEAQGRQQWVQWLDGLGDRLEKMSSDILPSGNGGQPGVQGLLAKAVEAYALAHYAESLGYVDRCLETDPSFEAAWQYKALCCKAMGMSDEAKAAANRTLQINPGNPVVKKMFGGNGSKNV
jgi:tetratricopeptide (TPR) repeat protein